MSTPILATKRDGLDDLLEGFRAVQCPQCGRPLQVQEGWGVYDCPGCGKASWLNATEEREKARQRGAK